MRAWELSGDAVADGAPAARGFRPERLVRTLAALAGLVSVLVILGWHFDVTALKAGLPGLGATQPMTAVALVLAATAMAISPLRVSAARAAVVSAAVLLIAGAVVVLAQNLLDADWGTDRLLFAETVASGQTGPFLRAGRPSGSSLVGLLGVALCLLTAQSGRTLAARVHLATATSGAGIALVLLLAHGFGITPLYALGLYAPTSLPAGIAFALLFSAALLLRPDRGWIARLTGDTIGAISARSMLAWAGAMMVVLVVVTQFAIQATWYRAELAVLAITATGVALLFFGVLAHLRRIDDLERQRTDLRIHTRTLDEHTRSMIEACEKLRREQRVMISHLSDELRNPLAALSYGIAVVKSGARPGDAPVDVVAMMERQVARLRTLLDTTLAEKRADDVSDSRRRG